MGSPSVGDLDHSGRHGTGVLVLPCGGRSRPGPRRIHDEHDVHLRQQDAVAVGDDGQVRVVRTPPVIAVEEHQLTLRGAALLRDVLDELLELASGA
jgi:hypothetical protein